MLLKKQLERLVWAVREDASYYYAQPPLLFIMEQLVNLQHGRAVQSKEGLAALCYHVKPLIVA